MKACLFLEAYFDEFSDYILLILIDSDRVGEMNLKDTNIISFLWIYHVLLHYIAFL